MLWEKEIHNENNVYVDLLRNIEYPRKHYRVHRRKDNKISMQLRLDGNEKYSQGDFEGALLKYNESACMAENKSEHLGLSYANRSQCFYKLELYQRCLVDIELARESGYPINLISKLDNRKEECEKHLKAGKIEKANSEWEDTVRSFKIETDDEYGRLARATRDIEIGETVLIEKAYIRTVNSEQSNECTNCGSRRRNFVPCQKCADAMYCCAACAENNFHRIECDMIIGTMENREYLGFIIRSVVIGISNFSNITEMTQFVENARSSSVTSSHYPQSSKSKYSFFLKLSMPSSLSFVEGLIKEAYFIFHAIIDSSHFNNKFTTITDKRFLMHLIVHHAIILQTNAFEFEEDEQAVHELCLYTSMFNHSCLPNIAKLSNGNLSVCKSILRIKKGDQIFLTYLQEDAFHMTEKQRNDQLQKKYEFRCKCKLCTDGILLAFGLDNDPCFKYVTSIADDVNDIDIDFVKENCIQFLTKYSEFLGSQEISYIADTLSVMFSKELNR
ncbi:hypothetical protein HA402_009609 [Bradysia odoriphaga]|nr:hypothetical protein HA402_009609 [Bradysia odoriphaga]